MARITYEGKDGEARQTLTAMLALIPGIVGLETGKINRLLYLVGYRASGIEPNEFACNEFLIASRIWSNAQLIAQKQASAPVPLGL